MLFIISHIQGFGIPQTGYLSGPFELKPQPAATQRSESRTCSTVVRLPLTLATDCGRYPDTARRGEAMHEVGLVLFLRPRAALLEQYEASHYPIPRFSPLVPGSSSWGARKARKERGSGGRSQPRAGKFCARSRRSRRSVSFTSAIVVLSPQKLTLERAS